MDIRYSDYRIKGLLAKGEFAPEYRELFCEYVDVLKDPSNVVRCASYMTL